MATDELPVKPYSLKTLMPGWQFFSMAYPKDYDAYDPVNFPRPKNLFISSYHRLGCEEAPWESATKISAQSALIKPKTTRSQFRPLINVLTYHTTEGEAREKYADQIGITDISDEEEKIVFETTVMSDYKPHFHVPLKVFTDDDYKTETKYRHFNTDCLNIFRPGLSKFYDENMDYLEVKRRPLLPPPFKTDYE